MSLYSESEQYSFGDIVTASDGDRYVLINPSSSFDDETYPTPDPLYWITLKYCAAGEYYVTGGYYNEFCVCNNGGNSGIQRMQPPQNQSGTFTNCASFDPVSDSQYNIDDNDPERLVLYSINDIVSHGTGPEKKIYRLVRALESSIQKNPTQMGNGGWLLLESSPSNPSTPGTSMALKIAYVSFYIVLCLLILRAFVSF